MVSFSLWENYSKTGFSEHFLLPCWAIFILLRHSSNATVLGSHLPSAGVNVQLYPWISAIYLPLTVPIFEECELRSGSHAASNSTRAQFSFHVDDLPLQQHRLPLQRSPPPHQPFSPAHTANLQPNDTICCRFYLFFSPQSQAVLGLQCSSMGISVLALQDTLPQPCSGLNALPCSKAATCCLSRLLVYRGRCLAWEVFVGLSRIISGFSNNEVSTDACEFTFLSPWLAAWSLTTDIMPQNCNTAPLLLDHSLVLFFFREEKGEEERVVRGAEVSSLLKPLAPGQEGFSWESPVVPWRT